jgi:hypothetical protein
MVPAIPDRKFGLIMNAFNGFKINHEEMAVVFS